MRLAKLVQFVITRKADQTLVFCRIEFFAIRHVRTRETLVIHKKMISLTGLAKVAAYLVFAAVRNSRLNTRAIFDNKPIQAFRASVIIIVVDLASIVDYSGKTAITFQIVAKPALATPALTWQVDFAVSSFGLLKALARK